MCMHVYVFLFMCVYVDIQKKDIKEYILDCSGYLWEWSAIVSYHLRMYFQIFEYN